MKKSRKMMLRIIPVLLVVVVMLATNVVFGVNVVTPSTGTPSTKITDFTSNIWGTVAVVVQTLAIAAIVLAGIRYMFAPAEKKGDIKQETVVLVVGAILVFAAVPVAQFISGAAADIIK